MRRIACKKAVSALLMRTAFVRGLGFGRRSRSAHGLQQSAPAALFAALAVGVCTSLITLSPPAIAQVDQLATNLRMQKVVEQFVRATGHQAIGLGSWISGAGYRPGLSDHDLRLVLPGADPVTAVQKWNSSRETLVRLIEKEFQQGAPKVLKSVNLYPPSQVMRGVEDAADALARYEKLGQVPNLGYSGPVHGAPTQFAEGLYGDGSKVWIQGYEKSAGRLWYSKDGRVYRGLTDLTHFSEGLERYTTTGMANTSTQWVDHAFEELKAGRGEKVGKYIERLERDLTKAKDLQRLGAPAFRAELRELASTLKERPGALATLQGGVEAALLRGRAEAAVMRQYERAGFAGKRVLEAVLTGLRNKGKIVDLLRKAGDVVSIDRIMYGLMIYTTIRETTRAATEEDYLKAWSAWAAGVLGIVSFPPGLMADLARWTTDAAIDGGCTMVANSQEAWDLIEGIYTAGGREDVEERVRSYNLEDLVLRIHDESKLKDLVYAKAMIAAARDAGVECDKADKKVAEKIFKRCYPIIFAGWRARRDALTYEYLNLADEVATTALLISYKPVPAKLESGGKVEVSLAADSVDGKLGQRLERMKQLLAILVGQPGFADTAYKWSDGREGNHDWERYREFSTPGMHPITVSVQVDCGTQNLPGDSPLHKRLHIKSGVDVEVQGPPVIKKKPTENGGPKPKVEDQTTGVWVLVDIEKTERIQRSGRLAKVTFGEGSFLAEITNSGDSSQTYAVVAKWTVPPGTIKPGEKITSKASISGWLSDMSVPGVSLKGWVAEGKGESGAGVYTLPKPSEDGAKTQLTCSVAVGDIVWQDYVYKYVYKAAKPSQPKKPQK